MARVKQLFRRLFKPKEKVRVGEICEVILIKGDKKCRIH